MMTAVEQDDDWTDARIDEAQALCAEAGLTADETCAVQGWLLGAVLTHFDPALTGSAPSPLSATRWSEYVRRAIADQ